MHNYFDVHGNTNNGYGSMRTARTQHVFSELLSDQLSDCFDPPISVFLGLRIKYIEYLFSVDAELPCEIVIGVDRVFYLITFDFEDFGRGYAFWGI